MLSPLKAFRQSSLQEVIGCTCYRGPSQSVEDLEAAIAAGVSPGMIVVDTNVLVRLLIATTLRRPKARQPFSSATKVEAFVTFDARMEKRAGNQANVRLV